MNPFTNLSHYSYKTAWLASVLLAGLLSPAQPAFAAGEYSVDNVAVDAGGSDTTDTRTKALSAGEMDAFKQLITRLAPARASEIIPKTTHPQVSVMVRGYEVLDEKMTANHYHATLRYNFDPKQIQALTYTPPPPAAAAPAPVPAAAETDQPAAAPKAASENKRKAVLVLPVSNEGTSLQLWQDENKWRSLWYDAALESGGGLVIMPLGSLDDRVDVDDTNVTSASAQSLARMYDRYGVGEVDVLSAFFNKKADPKPTLEVTVKRLSPGKEETVSHMNYTILSTETPDTLMVRAANDIAHSTYLHQTIDPNKIEYDRLKEINARINTSDIREWETLRKRLLAHGNIVGIKYNSVSFYETTMTITFRGTPDMLGKTLVAAGLRVMQDGDNLVLALK
jgi:hypothetical protein